MRNRAEDSGKRDVTRFFEVYLVEGAFLCSRYESASGPAVETFDLLFQHAPCVATLRELLAQLTKPLVGLGELFVDLAEIVSRLDQLLLGSTSERCLRGARIPVLISRDVA